MRRSMGMVAASLVATAITSGCAMHHHKRMDGFAGPFAACPPVATCVGVTVRKGATKSYPVVDQDPIVTYDKQVWIAWRLPDGPSTYTFQKPEPGNPEKGGIVVERKGRDEIINCNVEQDGRVYKCFNKNSRKDHYKYTINLLDGSNPTPISIDPIMIND